MYVLARIPIYSDRWRDLCCDPPGSQECAPKFGLGGDRQSTARIVYGAGHDDDVAPRRLFACERSGRIDDGGTGRTPPGDLDVISW